MNVLGVGVATVDLIACIDHFPAPDEKMRASEFSLAGGGNAANTIVALGRLGCNAKLLSRVGDDALGTYAHDLLKKEGINTSLLQIDKMPTPFSCILVETVQHTRTIIHCSKPATIHYTYNPAHLDNIDLVYA